MGLRKLLLSITLFPVFVVLSAMSIIALSSNKDSAMNKRLEARREKASETLEDRASMEVGNDLPKTLEGAYAAQDAITEYWESCIELLVKSGDYTDANVMNASKSDVSDTCGELVID